MLESDFFPHPFPASVSAWMAQALINGCFINYLSWVYRIACCTLTKCYLRVALHRTKMDLILFGKLFGWIRWVFPNRMEWMYLPTVCHSCRPPRKKNLFGHCLAGWVGDQLFIGSVHFDGLDDENFGFDWGGNRASCHTPAARLSDCWTYANWVDRGVNYAWWGKRVTNRLTRHDKQFSENYLQWFCTRY